MNSKLNLLSFSSLLHSIQYTFTLAMTLNMHNRLISIIKFANECNKTKNNGTESMLISLILCVI